MSIPPHLIAPFFLLFGTYFLLQKRPVLVILGCLALVLGACALTP